ncbi:MAG TPA: tetratricopeptide repeat protein [Pseudonocardiaceae bacterium]|nr:tetratricopeptide repeat protein [Pseudonocardiaceae bacterium]
MGAQVAEAWQADIDDFCGRLRRLRVESGNPTLDWLSRHPLCPKKSQLSKIFRGQVRRLPDADIVRGIVARCARWAEQHDRRPLLPLDERHWLIERDVVERRIDAVAARPAPVVPFQLPLDAVQFTGRTDDLARLLKLDSRPDPHDTWATVVITAVEGMAGIGKTALAVRAAHQLADRFPDGVLFADLHGFTPDTEPTPPAQVLDRLLHGLGVPGARIPPDLEARVGLYRSVLADRRVLIVLDNAAGETQLAPLLPGTPGCRAIITSRRHLAGIDDATHLTLSVLDPAEAADLFSGIAGDRATAADRDTIERIVTLCGYLPLAIRVTAARLRQAPAGNIAALCAELADALGTGRGLDWLSDGHRAVGASLAMSYRHLTEDQQHMFRLVGLHPGSCLEPYAMAALADTTVEDARRLLDDLHAASLLRRPGYRRYMVHDLVAAYATELAAELPEPDRRLAMDRLYDHCAAVSSLAVNLIRPWDASQQPVPPATRTPMPVLSDSGQAQAWLAAELDSLLDAAHHAATDQRPDHTLLQSTTLRRYLRGRGYYNMALALHERALEVARRTGNHHAEQDALNSIGNIHYLQERYEVAYDHCEQALAGARRSGNRTAEQEALRGMGSIHHLQCRYDEAADCYMRGLAIARQIGDHVAQQEALNGLSSIHYLRGRYEAAADCGEQALAGARRIGNSNAEAGALQGLAFVHHLQGRHDAAAGRFGEALDVARRIGHPRLELRALGGLGMVHYHQGRYGPAADCHRQALDIADRVNARNGQFEGHLGLGQVSHATDDHQKALTHHETALRLATELDQPADQARAHDGLARCRQALGDLDQARDHWVAALELLTGIGTDHTEDPDITTSTIRAHLQDLTRSDVPGPDDE